MARSERRNRTSGPSLPQTQPETISQTEQQHVKKIPTQYQSIASYTLSSFPTPRNSCWGLLMAGLGHVDAGIFPLKAPAATMWPGVCWRRPHWEAHFSARTREREKERGRCVCGKEQEFSGKRLADVAQGNFFGEVGVWEKRGGIETIPPACPALQGRSNRI